jgi:hypothetical protein
MKRRVFKLVKEYYDATGDDTIAKIFNKTFNDTTPPIVKNASVSVDSINSFDVTVTNFIKNILPVIVNSDNPESLFIKSINDFVAEAEEILVKLNGNNSDVNSIFNNNSNENILKILFNAIIAKAENIENNTLIINTIQVYYNDPFTGADFTDLLAETFNKDDYDGTNDIISKVETLITQIDDLKTKLDT